MNESEAFITQLCKRPGRCDFHCRGESRRGLRDHCDVKLERCGVGKLGHEQSCVWRVGGLCRPERRSVWLLI